MKIQFNNLTLIHNQIKNQVLKEINKTVDNNSYILSDQVTKFEQGFSDFTSTKYTIGCGNGTDAIELILRGLSIGPGDEVILPVNTFIATSLAISRTGAKPVFVDNDEFYLIDVTNIETAITNKTKAILAVNLYGQMADIKKLSKIAKNNNIYLIEDSAQSHGASQGLISQGEFSVAASYSFYPGKNLGAWGDGGAVTTNQKWLFEKIVSLRNQGSVKKYVHNDIGFNSRLDSIQACVLNEKLKYITSWNEERNQVAKMYFDNLSDIKKIMLPKIFGDNYHVWHLFVIRVSSRNKLMEYLNSQGIQTGIHYPKMITNQKGYKNHMQFKNNFTKASIYENKLMSLPIFPGMKKVEVDYVSKKIKEFTG